MRIVEYSFIAAGNDSVLIDAVNAKIADAWQPLGGPIQVTAQLSALAQPTLVLVQAIVRYDEMPGQLVS